jgi:hypothetical protein
MKSSPGALSNAILLGNAVHMIGGDHLLSDVRRRGLEESSLFPRQTIETKKQITFATCVVLILKAQMSTTPFRMASVFEAGIATCFIVTIVMVLLNHFSFSVFARTWAFGEAYTFPAVWGYSLSKKTIWIAGLIVIIGFLLVPTSRTSEIMIYIPDLLQRHWPDGPAILSNRWLLLYVFNFIAALPLMVTKRFGWFGPMSWFCLGCQATALICLIVHFVRSQALVGFESARHVVWVNSDYKVIVGAISEFCIAFFAHMQIVPSIQEMVNPSRERSFRTVWAANGVCWVLTFTAPLFGFLCNPTAPGGSIFRSMPNQEAPEIILGNVMMAVITLISAAYAVFFVGKAVSELIAPGATESRLAVWLSGFSICLLTIALALLGDVPQRVISEIEYQCILAMAYFLPPIYFWAQHGFKDRWAAVSALIMLVGLVMSGWSLSVLAEQLLAMADD